MMREMTLSQAAIAHGGTLMYPDCRFRSVSTDSRSLNEDELFVALAGERFDAHQFLEQVAGRACGMVVQRPAKNIGIPQWVVPDTTAALGQIASLNRDAFTGPVVAITGSSGKTTVKEMISSILGDCGRVLATRGNLNNHIGVPLTLLEIDSSHQFAVVEMGASAAGEISYLCQIAKPDVVLVTNVLPAHVAGFGSVAAIAAAKGEIYEGGSTQGAAVVNLDEPYASQWLKASATAQRLTFSMQTESADFRARDIRVDAQGRHSFALISPVGEVAVRLTLSGAHNVANALAAAACAYAAGASLENIAAGLGSVAPVPGRLDVKSSPQGARVIDDSYNANPGSAKAAINTLVGLSGRKVLVLGDMAELGLEEGALHYDIGRYAADKGVDELLAVGPLGKNTVKGFGANGHHFDDKEGLVSYLKTLLGSDLVVLVKGSRSAAMETVVQAITESGEQ